MKISLAVISLLLLAGSCHKKDNVPLPSNRWSINDEVLRIDKAELDEPGILYGATNSPVAYFRVHFDRMPVSNKNYSFTNDFTNLQPNEIFISVTDGPRIFDVYHSTNNSNQFAVTTFENGKLKIAVDDLWLKNQYNDSIKISMNVTQTN